MATINLKTNTNDFVRIKSKRTRVDIVTGEGAINVGDTVCFMRYHSEGFFTGECVVARIVSIEEKPDGRVIEFTDQYDWNAIGCNVHGFTHNVRHCWECRNLICKQCAENKFHCNECWSKKETR